MQDTITKEITVKAPKERVYNALTDSEQFTTWFPERIEGTLEAGERPILFFDSFNHKTQIYIEAAKPFEYFAYRWQPGGKGLIGDVLTVPNTLVEFRLEEVQGGTKVTMRESGFSTLPTNIAEQRYKDNSGGWEEVMDRLKKTLNK